MHIELSGFNLHSLLQSDWKSPHLGRPQVGNLYSLIVKMILEMYNHLGVLHVIHMKYTFSEV